MRATWFFIAALVVVLAGSRWLAAPGRAWAAEHAPPLPAFTSRGAGDWINSEPLTTADLRGRVVLLDVWTFQCWNCYRSFPWLKELESRFADRAFTVIGVHSPEFEAERDRGAVAAAVRRFGLTHPVMIDNDLAYWRALNNRFWPAFYLVDRQGRIRAVFVGETHSGDAQARRIETEIEALLQESSGAG